MTQRPVHKQTLKTAQKLKITFYVNMRCSHGSTHVRLCYFIYLTIGILKCLINTYFKPVLALKLKHIELMLQTLNKW